MTREKLKDERYFQEYREKSKRMQSEFYRRANERDREYKKRLGSAYNYFATSLHCSVAAYSAGRPVAEVKALAVDAIDALAVFVALGEQDVDYFLYGDGGGYSGGFDHWYRLLGWCILFDLPRNTTDIVLDYLSLQLRNPRFATDALVNKMVKYLGYPGQDETDHLLWPEAYASLYECFKLSESYRSRQLEDFMKRWYKEMSDTYWYEIHKSKHDVYFGYWCFEAAAVAKMLAIDDEALKDHPNYPYDARHDAA